MTPFKILWRNFSSSNAVHSSIKNLVVVGGGLMGSGIAQVAAQAGIDVTIVEVNNDAIQKANNNIQTSVQKVAKKAFKDNGSEADKFISDTLKRLRLTTDLSAAVKDADLVIEAIIENLESKHKLFSTVDAIAPAKTIFASNTSSLSIKDIASVTKRKDRFLGLHFFNPVPVMKLLEVIRINETTDETFETGLNFGKTVGKVTVSCKDTPGFIVNKLLIPFTSEAVAMLERGDASARDIDTALKLGLGHPMGPIELMDFVGLDVSYYIAKGWHEKYPDNPQFKPSALLEKLVKEGKTGVKSGEGFYSYKK